MNIYIIAEAGVNHNGSLEMALKLVDAAREAGADAIKFQTFKASKLVSRHAPKAEYQTRNTDSAESQLDMIKKLELSEDAHRAILLHCEEKGIKFLSTPFDEESMDFLFNLGMDTFKIPSGEVTNLPYLRKIATYNMPVILSTGMCTLGDVEASIKALVAAGLSEGKITLLHCNTEYPTPDEDVNLRAMQTLARQFPKVKGIGYSDHSSGLHACFAAAALGATVLEKHFTLSRELEGPDHKSSLEPNELKELVEGVRRIEKMLGNGVKEPSASERPNMIVARKSIVAASFIKKGNLLTSKNITVKRPGNGISPMRWDEIIGKAAIRDFEEDELIEI